MGCNWVPAEDSQLAEWRPSSGLWVPVDQVCTARVAKSGGSPAQHTQSVLSVFVVGHGCAARTTAPVVSVWARRDAGRARIRPWCWVGARAWGGLVEPGGRTCSRLSGPLLLDPSSPAFA